MIVTRRDGAILTIAFQRSEARNAIPAQGWDALADELRQIAASDAAAVIVRSDVPGIFSAGADLTMLEGLAHDAALRSRFRERMAAAVEGLAALPMPTIAAVDGGCYGAAVALVLACDICVAGDAAVFATTPAKLGIGYPGSDVARLATRVGSGHAARMLLTAAAVDADEAVRIGLAHVRAPVADVHARAMATSIADNAPSAVRLLKATLADPGSSDEAFDAAFGEPAFLERLAAFRNRPR